MDHPILSHAPASSRADGNVDGAQVEHSSQALIEESDRTLRVHVPSVFVYYAMETLGTLH